MAAVACGTPEDRTAPATSTPKSAGGRVEAAFDPKIDPADFVDEIDNPYHPLVPGTVRSYEGTSDGEKETNKITVTNDKKMILGVSTTVVRDTVYDADGEVTEDTFDWFAQDKAGNVWYFGEATKEFSDGEADTHGSWEAGVDGAKPGIVMLASPKVGDFYREEHYEGEAEDEAKVVAVDESVKVPYGSFTDVLVTENRNPLEPELLERKYYAKGVGAVYEKMIRGGKEELQLVDVKR
jgi:hypothetical protein